MNRLCQKFFSTASIPHPPLYVCRIPPPKAPAASSAPAPQLSKSTSISRNKELSHSQFDNLNLPYPRNCIPSKYLKLIQRLRSNKLLHVGIHPQICYIMQQSNISKLQYKQEAVLKLAFQRWDIIGTYYEEELPMVIKLHVLSRCKWFVDIESGLKFPLALLLASTTKSARIFEEELSDCGNSLQIRRIHEDDSKFLRAHEDQEYFQSEVCVGLPGPIVTLVKQGYLMLSGVQCLVLHVSDQMDNDKDVENVRFILDMLPEKCQVILLSRSPTRLTEEISKCLSDPVNVYLDTEGADTDPINGKETTVPCQCVKKCLPDYNLHWLHNLVSFYDIVTHEERTLNYGREPLSEKLTSFGVESGK